MTNKNGKPGKKHNNGWFRKTDYNNERGGQDMRKLLILALSIFMVIFISTAGTAEENTLLKDRTVSFDQSSYIVYIGKQLKLVATVENVLETAPKRTQLIWTSSDQEVATVSANGTVTGKKSGKTTVTVVAKDNESISAAAEVEVRVPVQSLQINEKSASVVVGGKEDAEKTQLTVTIKPMDAFFKSGVWSSSDESVATVDKNGLVTGKSAGTAIISFASDDPNGQKKTQLAVKVGQAVEGITISASGNNVPKGKTLALKAVVAPDTATNKKIIWSSSDENIATVNPSGQVKGINPGQAQITAEAVDGSGISDSVNIEVVSPVKKLSLSVKKIPLAPGYDWQMTPAIEPEDATIKDLIWSSTNEKVATVDQNGLIHGVATGSAKINAVASDGSGVKATVNVTVKEYDYVLAKTSDRPQVKYSVPNGIWGIAFRSSKKCVSSESETLTPLKAGEDTFTVLMQSYMTGKIRKKKFSVLVLPSAIK